MENRSFGALTLTSALAVTALAPVGVGAEPSGTGERASAAGVEDTTPPRVRNTKLNDPEVSDLLNGAVLRLELTANEPCVVETQLVFKGEVLGTSKREILSKGGTRVAKLGLSRKGRAIVMREDPQKVNVGIQATDRAGNRAKSRAFQR